MFGIEQILATIFALLVGITFHEFSHAFVANLLGDPTARLKGRVTLNPIKHLDPLGTIMMIYAGINGIGFGWGKPVPINPYNLKRPRIDEFLIAIAGPISNFLIAFACGLLLKGGVFGDSLFMMNFLNAAIVLNIWLMVFNILPLPPLDGAAILPIFFPKFWAKHEQKLERYGGIVLLLLLFFFRGVLFGILRPVFSFFLGIIT